MGYCNERPKDESLSNYLCENYKKLCENYKKQKQIKLWQD